MSAQVVDRILVNNRSWILARGCFHCCCVVLRFDVSHRGQAEIEVQLKEVKKTEIKGVVSQIKEEKRRALEAFEGGNTELFAFYNKSLEALYKREEALYKREEALYKREEALQDERKALREKEAKLMEAALVSTKVPSAGTCTLIAGCRPV
jgi:phosphoglycolate phosphatase-like HAD superfamily hydrolase